MPPLRHVTIHERVKAAVVAALREMQDLVQHDIGEADGRFRRELQIDPDAPRLDIAGSPARLHVLRAPLPDKETCALFERGCQLCHARSKRVTILLAHEADALRICQPLRHGKEHLTAAHEESLATRAAPDVHDKHFTLAPEVDGLARQIAMRLFHRQAAKLLLFLLNPRGIFHDERLQYRARHGKGRREHYASLRALYMQMHALDVLALEFDGDDFAIRVYQSDFSHTIIGSHIAAPFPPHLAGSRAAAAVRGYEPSPPH